MKPRLSVVVPVYCNQGSLVELYQRLMAALAPLQTEWELIFVDDGSTDGSVQVLRNLTAQDKRICVLKLSRNFGSNVALMAGLERSQGDCVVMIAADLQDPPELIPEMFHRWQAGTRVVIAARRRRQDPILTRLPAAMFNYLFRRFVFPNFPLRGYDFALIDRRVVNVLTSSAERNTFVFGLILWSGFTHEVISYDRAARKHGKSMWTFAKKVKYFVDAFAAFSYLPVRIASLMGLVMTMAGVSYALFILGERLLENVPVRGWSSLMIVVLLASGAQLLMLGIIGEYIWRGLDQSRHRPLYIVDEIIGQLPELNENAVSHLRTQDEFGADNGA